MRARGFLAVLGAVGVVVGALGVAPAAATTPAPVLPPPSSMAALGDSFTRGFAAGPPACNSFAPCPQYSWSTGTAVNSHAARLTVLEPALAGHVLNVAQPGASMVGLVGQAALVASAHPEYVTVLLGGGDICFGATSAATFAAQFRAGMDALFAATPQTHVLVASIWNFESMRAAVLAGNPSATWSFCGGFFNAPPAARAGVMARVAQYNSVLEAECATYVNCRYDGGTLFDHIWTPAEVSSVDNVHPSVAGQEMIAQVLFEAGYRWATQPPDRDACKRGGWATFVDASGAPFKNQGDCVSFVATGGRNPAAG